MYGLYFDLTTCNTVFDVVIVASWTYDLLYGLVISTTCHYDRIMCFRLHVFLIQSSVKPKLSLGGIAIIISESELPAAALCKFLSLGPRPKPPQRGSGTETIVVYAPCSCTHIRHI